MEEALKKILEALRAKPEVIEFGEEHKVLSRPDGSIVDLRQFLPPPNRIRQRVEMLNVPSFAAYVMRYATDDTVIFANEPAASYEAVLDYHVPLVSNDDPLARNDCDHTVVYTCPQSDQWKLWNKGNGSMQGQVEFATFLENNLRDIHSPSPAEFMELCLHFQIHKTASFESGHRLTDGQTQFHYSEEIRGSSNKKAGHIDIPATFRLAIPVFVDGPRYELEARFKYRLHDGALSLGYDLIRPLEVYTAAVKEVTEQIQKGCAERIVLVGKR
jgi:uncharacterized protein YfdQ (DUF2303 family)